MVAFNKGLDAFYHSLIPTHLRETLAVNSVEYFRVRALSAVLVITTIVVAVSNLVMGGVHLLFHQEILKYDVISWVIFAFLAIQTLLFYKFNNYWISGLAFTNFYFIGTVLLLIMSGGYDYPGKTILLTCPLVSFLIGGKQEGIQNSMMSIFFILMIIFFKRIGFELPNYFKEESPYVIFVVNWVITTIIVSYSFMVYIAEAQRREQIKAETSASGRG